MAERILALPLAGVLSADSANSAWWAQVGLAADLGRWFQLARLRGDVRQAEPKPLPWRLWHVPARLVRSGRRTILRGLDIWPHATPLLGAYRRFALLSF